METLILEKKDEVYLTVDAEPSIQRELSEFFTFYVPGYKFMPAFRNRMWDGKIRMFSQKTKEIYFGLFPYIKSFAEERGYNVVCGEDVEIDNKVDRELVEKFSNSLGQKFEARDYQVDAIYHSLKFNRALLLSPTASGKSFIIYSLIRYYSHLIKDDNNNRILLIVPTTSLVEQMTKDFIDYGYKEPICKIYHGQEVFDAPITVTTWQSFAKAPKEVLQSFDVVVGDEAHLFKATTLKGILEKMKTTAIRIGTTGTLDGTEVHRLQLEGLFGPVKKVVSSAELIEDGTIAKIDIQTIILRHTKQKKMSYQDEMDYLVSHQGRNQFITNLVGSLRGNTLVLFQYVEKHGQVLWEMFNPMVGRMNGQLHYVYGGTDTEDRENVREIVEKSKKKKNVILG